MKKKTRRIKWNSLILSSLSVVMICYFVITAVSYTVNYFSLRKEEKELKLQLSNLQQQKFDLKMEIEKLNDPEYVARFAKEKYYYSNGGEYIIKLDNSLKPVQETTKDNTYFIYIALGIVGASLIFLGIKKRTKSSKV